MGKQADWGCIFMSVYSLQLLYVLSRQGCGKP